MKILLTHAYARKNNGDAAILYAQLNELQRILPSAKITISTMEDTSVYKDFYGTPQVPALISSTYKRGRSRAANLYHLVRSLIGGYIWAITFNSDRFKSPLDFFMLDPEKEFLNKLQEADMVVPVGGGYILSSGSGIFDLIDLILILQPLYLATKIKKPVLLYSQSIGPFKSNLQKKIVAKILRRCTQINVREDISFKLLETMDIPADILQRTADAAFLLPNHKLNKTASQKNDEASNGRRLLIGVTARAWLKEKEQATYEYQLAMALDSIVQKYNADILFIPQVAVPEKNDDDRIVQSKIFGLMSQKQYATNINDVLDFISIKDLYGNLDYLIGTRFHSVIFALSEGIPCIAIEYLHKTSGIMHDLDLDKWVIKIQNLNKESLVGLFDELIICREDYKRQLADVIPIYIEQAREANNLILQMGNRS